MNLWIANFQTGATAEAEEFNYLFGWLVSEAKLVFDTVTVGHACLQQTGVIPDSADYVLIIGKDPVYLSARSLKQMINQLDSSCDVILPASISGFPDIAGTPLYTLSDFQRLEIRLLEQQRRNIDKSSNAEHQLPWQVSLWHRSPLQNSWVTISSAINQQDWPEALASSIRLKSTGIFHFFEDYFGQTRKDILPFIPTGTADILEIGCGKGHTGNYLQQQLGCRVSGVEMQPLIAAEATTRLHKVHTADVEALALEQSFDVILALDVIEHLHHPDDFLTWARKHLNESGSLVAVIPNVGHYSVVRDLLTGRWDYVPMGILCVTHVRFFTRSTLELWLRMAGFSEWEITNRKSILPKEVEDWSDAINADLESLATEAFYIVAKR